VWGNGATDAIEEAAGVLRDNPLLLEAIERLIVIETQIGLLRNEVANVTRPAEPVTPGNGVTGVMHNKVTNSPERLAYLREYAKKRRAEAKA
jgi:hypothetical protein